jgi:hypothetical protein
MLRTLMFGAAVLVLSSCSRDAVTVEDAPAPEPAAAEAPDFEHTDYADMANWLCHPDKANDACAIDLSATAIAADGTTTLIAFTPAVEPAFDCFYIYPTVSFDTTPNSDTNAGPEELNVVANQFARYGEACRLFAPMYRQTTLLELQKQMMTGQTAANDEMRYSDIITSWNTYLANENKGRGVLLVGHSQGASMIYQMLEKDIVGSPAMDKLVVVHAIGYETVIDPTTGLASGLPVCTSEAQTGCLVSFASFREPTPPSVDSFFGKAQDGKRAVCTNPAGLGAGKGSLRAFMPRQSFGRMMPNDYGVAVDTPFVTLPGLLTAECQSNDTHDWLAVSINADPADPRADDIPGDLVFDGKVVADWGLHLVDMNLAMGNLVDLAKSEGAAWQAAQTAE